MMQVTYAWLQSIAMLVLISIVLISIAVGMLLRFQVTRKKMSAQVALVTIEWFSNIIGIIVGPLALFILLSIIMPTFARWSMNWLVPTTTIYQAQLQLWIDSQVVDDLSATGIGAVLSKGQLGLAMLFPILGLGFKLFLKFLMGRAYHANLLRQY